MEKEGLIFHMLVIFSKVLYQNLLRLCSAGNQALKFGKKLNNPKISNLK